MDSHGPHERALLGEFFFNRGKKRAPNFPHCFSVGKLGNSFFDDMIFLESRKNWLFQAFQGQERNWRLTLMRKRTQRLCACKLQKLILPLAMATQIRVVYQFGTTALVNCIKRSNFCHA